MTYSEGDNAKVLKASWEAVSDHVRRVFLEAESKRGDLNSINLGSTRTFTVGEAALWASFGGVMFASQVATVVSPEAPATRCDKKISVLFKDTKAIRFGNSTPLSINKYLVSSVFSPRPRLLKKGTAAAVAEAAEAEAVAHAAAELADTQKKASFYDAALRDDPGARDRARMAQSDDPLITMMADQGVRSCSPFTLISEYFGVQAWLGVWSFKVICVRHFHVCA